MLERHSVNGTAPRLKNLRREIERQAALSTKYQFISVKGDVEGSKNGPGIRCAWR
jgi:hypothetical protein